MSKLVICHEYENPTRAIVGDQTRVKNAYHKLFPTDDIYNDINPYGTFEDVYKTLLSGQDVYKFLAYDSIVRERIFWVMSEYMGKPYDHFYYLWLHAGRASFRAVATE